jgi:hypothetical protein
MNALFPAVEFVGNFSSAQQAKQTILGVCSITNLNLFYSFLIKLGKGAISLMLKLTLKIVMCKRRQNRPSVCSSEINSNFLYIFLRTVVTFKDGSQLELATWNEELKVDPNFAGLITDLRFLILTLLHSL